LAVRYCPAAPRRTPLLTTSASSGANRMAGLQRHLKCSALLPLKHRREAHCIYDLPRCFNYAQQCCARQPLRPLSRLLEPLWARTRSALLINYSSQPATASGRGAFARLLAALRLAPLPRSSTDRRSSPRFCTIKSTERTRARRHVACSSDMPAYQRVAAQCHCGSTRSERVLEQLSSATNDGGPVMPIPASRRRVMVSVGWC